jgi:hypothetical protein
MAVCLSLALAGCLLTSVDPLRSGLNVKSPGAPVYTPGRDGDLRDIWKRVAGEIPLEKNTSPDQTAKIITVYGKEDIVEHDVAEITKEISVIGNYLKDHGAKRVAIYLPNSVEFLAALFGEHRPIPLISLDLTLSSRRFLWILSYSDPLQPTAEFSH